MKKYGNPAKMSVLETAKLKVPGQNYVVLNVVGPGLRQKTKDASVRILGCFDSKQSAEEHAEQYRQKDDRFDIFVADMYQFLPIPDQVHDVGNVKYDEKKLNDLFDAHDSSRTQTEEWNKRIEDAKEKGEDKWGLAGL